MKSLKTSAMVLALTLSAATPSRADVSPEGLILISTCIMATTFGALVIDEDQHSRLLEDTRADAALFLASGGSAEPGLLVRELINKTREAAKNPQLTDLEIAEAMLAAQVK